MTRWPPRRPLARLRAVADRLSRAASGLGHAAVSSRPTASCLKFHNLWTIEGARRLCGAVHPSAENRFEPCRFTDA